MIGAGTPKLRGRLLLIDDSSDIGVILQVRAAGM